jgi:uncharacterized protein involved in exopolysaccharide biosynthesis
LPYGPAEDSGEGVAHPGDMADIGDIWRVFFCRRRVILAVVAGCFLAALAYAMTAPPQYASTAEIFIDPRDRQILTKDVNPDTLAADGGLLQVETQARVIGSDAVLLRAVESAGLDRDPDFGGRSTSPIGTLLGLVLGEDGTGEAAQKNKALRVLRKNLSVKRADKVFVIDVTVTAKTAEKAARISGAVAEAYIADQIAARGQSARRASDALAARLADLRDGVRDAETRVEKYKAAHDIVGTNKELVTDQQLDDSGAKLENARTKSQEFRARLDQIEALRRSGGDAGSIPEALQSSVITQLRASAQDLLRRESDLRTRVGERHPDLIALVEQVQEVKRQINAELDRLARGARSDYERALAYEHSLSANFDKSKLKTQTVEQDSVELHELNRELDARRSLYQVFLARAAETRAQADIDTTNDRIISKAIPPGKPSWPPRVFIILGAIGGGLGLGAGLALLLEYCSPTILSPSQLERLAEAPVIGVLHARRQTSLQTRRQRKAPWPSAAPRPDNEIALALSCLCGPIGALRGIPDPYSLLLVSAQGDTVARLQAIDRIVTAAEERGLSILLIEASEDISNGSARGFLNVVNGECALRAAVQAYGGRGTKRLGIGFARNAASRDLQEAQIDRFLEDAGRYFDLILFDAGAFEQNPGLASLAGRADDVLLVAVQGVTSQQAARDMSSAIIASTGQPVSASLLMQAAA